MNHPEHAAQAGTANAGLIASREPAFATVQAGPPRWQNVCALDEIPQLGARVVKSVHGNIAIFRTADDEVFALADKCPHKGGPLSQGIVFGRKVACPLHGWNVALEDGHAVAPDLGCARTFPVKLEAGAVFLLIEALRAE